jgi:hypothetical protein
VPHPRGGVIDVTAPLPQHMQQSWNLLGFDVKYKDINTLDAKIFPKDRPGKTVGRLQHGAKKIPAAFRRPGRSRN